MIYESYLLYHNVYILMAFHFNTRNKTIINTKAGVLIIKSLTK
jgi:hypothetical protein